MIKMTEKHKEWLLRQLLIDKLSKAIGFKVSGIGEYKISAETKSMVAKIDTVGWIKLEQRYGNKQ